MDSKINMKIKIMIKIGGRSAHTTTYEASGSSGTARQEGVAVSLVYIGEIECAPPPAAAQRSTPPNYFKTFQLFQNFRAFRVPSVWLFSYARYYSLR